MAWTKVQGVQTAGSANNTAATITAATAGNTLVSFFSQTGLNTPTCTGFTVEAVKATYNSSLSTLWVATKIAAGGETSVSWTAGSGGTGHGVAVFELAGGPAVITKDGSVVHTDNIASATTGSLAVATSSANSIILLAVGGDTSSGTISAWTGTNVATNIGTAAARCFGGSFITTTTVSSTFTANWATAHVTGMLAIALQVSSGAQTVSVTGKSSAAAFGAVTIATGPVTVSVPGKGSAASFGSLQANIRVIVSGLGSAAAFGSTTALPGARTVPLSGIGSAASFGTVSILTGNTNIQVTGKGSAGAFGAVSAGGGTTVNVTGKGSAAAFGAVTIVVGGVVVLVAGKGSAAAFGVPTPDGGGGAPTFNVFLSGRHHR